MEDMTSTVWQRRGSSVVFNGDLLGPLISSGCMISLREILGWVGSWPTAIPGGQSTVLVSGLEAALEVMEKTEAENFLRCKITPIIQEFQSRWDAVGLILGFGCSANRFRIDTFENVLFKCPGGNELMLSNSLWNGCARHDMCRIMTKSQQTNNLVLGGFYVKRLS